MRGESRVVRGSRNTHSIEIQINSEDRVSPLQYRHRIFFLSINLNNFFFNIQNTDVEVENYKFK